MQQPPGQLQTPAGDRIPEPVAVAHLHLGGKGKAEAHEEHARRIKRACRRCHCGLQPQFSKERLTQVDARCVNADHTGGVQIQGQGIQPTGPNLLAALFASGDAAQEHGVGGKQQQPRRQGNAQGRPMAAENAQELSALARPDGVLPQGEPDGDGGIQRFRQEAVGGIVVSPAAGNAPLGIRVVRNGVLVQVFPIAQRADGIFQRLHRLRAAVHRVDDLSRLVQDLIGDRFLIQPVPVPVFKGPVRHFLRHPAVFHAGPFFRQTLRGAIFPVPCLVIQVGLIRAVLQQPLLGQNKQADRAARSRRQTGGAERNGNKFDPKRISHGLASIL